MSRCFGARRARAALISVVGLGSLLGGLAACGSGGPAPGDHEHPEPHRDDAPAGASATRHERPVLSWTDWSDRTELFVELPALVVGLESSCAAHVTLLEEFAPLTAGMLTVVLRGGPSEERFAVDGPTDPGIFRPIATPARAGRRQLIVEIRAGDLVVDHDLGEVVVYPASTQFDAAEVDRSGSGRVTFLKEQQWRLEFETHAIAQRALRPSLAVLGSIVARPESEVVVAAPVPGRIEPLEGVFPSLGQVAARGEALARLIPRLEAADLASLDLAVTSAGLELRLAQRERERTEALYREGVVAERRLLAAVHAEDEATAALAAARRRLHQFRRVQRTAGRGEGAVELRAPLSGSITQLEVAPGAFVEAGDPLFRLTDTHAVWIEAMVPEIDVPRLGELSGATFTMEGDARIFAVESTALPIVARHIDPRSRTLSVLYPIDNSELGLPIDSFARVQLMIGPERDALAVPQTALIDDGGSFVVFVQVEGEAFERRIVRVGLRDRGWVEVTAGLVAGEHVVTRGAWSVHLAATSGVIPAHGHSH